MKLTRIFGVCALAAAGLAANSFGQIQVAGNLQVNVDATTASVGTYTYLTNSGALGGVFVVTNHIPGNNTGISPQIIAVGGTGTHGALLDGNSFLRHFTAETGNIEVLPPESLTGGNPVFSVEVWVAKSTILSEYAAVSWGTRSTGLEVSCNWGYHGTWGGFSFYGSGCDYAWANVPKVGAWRHLVWTYDGAGALKLYCDGVLDSVKAHTAALNVSPTNNILIGAQHNGSAIYGLFAGVIGKVRIHDGVLTDAQVANNYAAEAAGFAIPADALLTSAPLHRYSFNLPATNNALGLTVPDTGTAAGAPAVVQGSNVSGALPTFDGDQLVLTSYGSQSYITNSYVDLPNGLLSSLSSSNGGSGQVTLELWVNYRAANNWVELAYFGNSTIGEILGPGKVTSTNANSADYNGANGLVIVPAQINTSQDQSGVRGAVGNKTISARLVGGRKHIVVTWDELSNMMKLYHEGIQVGQFTADVKMNAIIDVNNWLGRSGWRDANGQASYREFRIYNRLLSGSEIYRNYRVGPYDASDSSSLTWNGNVNGNWDTSTLNWLVGGVATNFADGRTVLFGDNATGTTTINLASTVTPGATLGVNSIKNYTFSGTGKISGTGGLTKAGPGSLTFTGTPANDYTGPNVIAGGKVVVSSLADGGSPSAIGASSANPANLVLSGGTLSYQGTATTIDRGYLLTDTNSAIEVQNGLTLSGTVLAAGNGGLVKSGPGTLTYSTIGSNLLSAGGFPGFNVARGAVVFDGTGGGQTNRNMSELWVGSDPAYGGNMIISNATLLADTWVSVGRGTGTGGNTSSLTLNNGNLTIAANGLSLGYNAGRPNLANQLLTLNGNSTIYMPGYLQIGESSGSSGSAYLNGTSWIRNTRLLLGMSSGATGALYMAHSAAITNSGGYTSIGQAAGSGGAVGGVGTMVIKDNAAYYSTGDFNVSDTANSIGQLDIQDNAVITTGAGYVGKAAGSIGVINMSGGSLTAPGANFQIGQYGQGTINQSGGVITIGQWPSIGRFAAGVGIVNVSGGTFAQTNTTTDLMVPEEGNATLTVSGTGLVSVAGRIRMGNSASAVGTINLDGGMIVTKQIWTPYPGIASSTFSFNGGVLKAADDANADFLSGLSYAQILAGGARIDSGNNSITIGQDLYDAGGGSLTKLGSGTLRLSGNLTYNGPTLVSAGKLEVTTAVTGQSPFTLADSTTLGLQVSAPGTFITLSGLTIGSTTGASVDFDLGNFGNPSQPPLNITGMLTLNGPSVINIVPTSTMAVGTVPLISYVAPKTGAGSFTLGTLPPGVDATLTDDGTGLVSLNVTNVSLPRWDGQAGGTWDIGVATNWIDRLTSEPMFFQQGFSTVFDDSALGTTSVNLTTNVAPGGVLVSNTVLNYTINGTGRIGGNGGLTKLGTGTLTLSTTNNNYTGATKIDEGGTLVSTVPNNLGTNNALLIGTGTLSLGANSQRFSSVTVTNGNIASSGATITATSYGLAGGNINAVLAGGSLTTFGTNNDVASVLGLNTYTGPTVLAGNPLIVTNLANGGSPSGVGASSANPTNLVFRGGTLTYAGAPATTDRGYTVAAGGSLSASGNLTLQGPVVAGAGNFSKSGPAALIYARPGTNLLTTGGYYVSQGTLLFDGGAGVPGNYLQTNRINGELWIGYDQVNAGALVLTNTSLGLGSWLAIDRGNGTIGSSSKVTLYDSVLTAPNFSMGYNAGIAGNSSFPMATLLGNSSLTINARTFIGESPGADARVLLAGNSRWVQNSEWFALGNSGKGTLILSNSAFATFPGDYNLGDVSGGDGTLYIFDNATNLALTMYVGKGNDSGPAVGVVNQYGGYVGKSASGGGDWRIGGNSSTATVGSVGIYNLYGGIFEPQNNFQIGAWGTGYWNQSGGVANCASYPVVGRFPGSFGTMTVSGGVFNQTGTGQLLIIGEEGTGTLTITNTGLVTSANGVSVGHRAPTEANPTGGVGTVNLDGGTLQTTRVIRNEAGASSTFNFNGGVLQAGANNATFMTGLGSANVLARGAIVDSADYSITIGQALLEDSASTGGGLTKLGTGVLTLSGVNTYSGPTVVNTGALLVNGTIAGAATVKAGAALGGNGTIAGTVTVEAGGVLSAGTSIGTLTLSSSPVLAGTVVAELDRNSGAPLADRIVAPGNPIAYGGTLVVTNTGAPLQVNDTFTIFNASGYSGSFTLVSQTPGQEVTWDLANLTVNGSIRVSSIKSVSTTPPDIGVGRTGNTLNLTWPADHLGWTLETNAIGVTTVNSWFPYPGSDSVTNVNITINPNATNLFLRLVFP